jgi:glycosyltransferase involved in cell wall biosynthesis
MTNVLDKMLTLSIVIPVFNEENYLKACLDSIVAQTVMPQQVIVVDNNCSDKSMEIARSYKFVKIIEEKSQGIVYARNQGFNFVNTDLIGRIDADSILGDNWIETAIELANKHPEVGAFTGPCYFYTPLGHSFWFVVHRLIYFWSSRLIFGHTILFGSNMFIRKKAWDSVKLKTCADNSLHEDMDLSHHLASNGGVICFSPKLKATISIRRFKHGLRYPKMWLKTRLIH